jgi:SAM-dependent methyltransferase
MSESAEIEKAKYDVIWREFPDYRVLSPGEAFAPFFFDGFKDQLRAGQTIIDFGCGTARVAKEFIGRGLHATLVDISPYCLDEEIRNMLILFSHQLHFVQACLWQLPDSLKSAYWIYCCDVLEHIPPDYVEPVLEAIASRMRFGGYFSICLKEDLSGKKWGHPLHLTVREKGWWEERLLKHFKIVSEDALADEIYFNCRVQKREASS